MGGRLVDRVRVGPLGEQAQGLAAHFLRQFLVDGDADHAGGVGFATEAESAVHETAQHEGRPGATVAGIEERGDGRAAGLEGEVMDGADGLVGHDRGGVVHETRRGRIEATAQRDDGREAH